MKTKIGGEIFHLTKYVLFFFIILLVQSCASTSDVRLEGDDFNNNLPGQWEGKWYWGSGVISNSGKTGIKIIKIDGNKVYLTGYSETDSGSLIEEVYGRIENSALLLTWPTAGKSGCEDMLIMKRDESNSLVLEGPSRCANFTVKVQVKKIE